MSTHPFARFSGDDHHRRLEAQADAAFEEGKVLFTLRAFGLNAARTAAELRRHEEAERGVPALTFRAFHARFPSFPLLLGTSRLDGGALHLDRRALLPALFREFTRAPFVTAYEAFYERHAERAGGRPVGLVFPRKGLRHGLVVYAGGLDDLPFGPRETALVYAGGPAAGGRGLVVRSYQRLLEALRDSDRGWRPDGEEV